MNNIKKNINIIDAREVFLKNLEIFFDVDKVLVRKFTEIFELKSYPKKTIIIEEGTNTDKVSFIISGLVRIYYKKDEKEITTWLLPENKFFMPVFHIFTGGRNYNNYEAIEDTIVLESTYKKMEELYDSDINLERMGRLLVQNYYAYFLKYSYNVLFLSAEERYKIFVGQNEELLNRVPLKYIASYLGITQETLSRIRSNR